MALLLTLFLVANDPSCYVGKVYRCHYIFNDWGELNPTFAKIGKNFDYEPFRRSDLVEDHRTDEQILMDDVSIHDYRASYQRALNHHDKLPSIMVNVH